MQTFKEFLLSEDKRKARTQVVDVETFIKWADNNASVYLNGPHFLYRGGSGDRQKGLRIGNAAGRGITPRVSANTANNYTIWIDGHPAFKGWPKRSLSFIATDDRDVAENFGGAALLLIHDEAKVGIVGESDLWETPLKPTDVTIEELNGLTAYLLEVDFTTYASLKEAMLSWEIEEIEEAVSSNSAPPYRELLSFMGDANLNNLYELWEALVTPRIFSGMTTGARVGDKAPDGEVWIQGEVGFIPHIKRLSKEDAARLGEWVDQYPELQQELMNNHWGANYEEYYGDDE